MARYRLGKTSLKRYLNRGLNDEKMIMQTAGGRVQTEGTKNV